MSKRPSLKDQLTAQRTANTSMKSAPVADTFRKETESEPRVRTSMYLPESLAKDLKYRAVEEKVRANEIVIKALSAYLRGSGRDSL